jgi:hypothetical protein
MQQTIIQEGGLITGKKASDIEYHMLTYQIENQEYGTARWCHSSNVSPRFLIPCATMFNQESPALHCPKIFFKKVLLSSK